MCTQERVNAVWTQQTVNMLCSQNSKLMFYVQTRDSKCCMSTKQTVNAVCAHSRQLKLPIHTTHS